MDQIKEIKDSLMNDEFNSLTESRERVEYSFEKLGSIEDIRPKVHKFLSDYKNENLKSVHKSQEFREKGNLYFSKKNYEYALYYYNSAVMYAPYPTESGAESDNELTYVFTARSLTFFELKAYENALFDINCALSISEFSMKFTDRLQLMTHKVYCLCRLKRYYTALTVVTAIIQLVPCFPIHNQTVGSLIKMRDQITDRISQESGEPNEQNQCELDLIDQRLKSIESFLSPELQLYETSTKGRHYRAVAPIPKGKIVAVEKALTGILFKPFFSTHCQNCCKNLGYKCWPCKHCSQVVFCDQECSERAYHHKYECGLIDYLQNLGTNHHLLYRIILLVGPQMAIELARESTSAVDLSKELDPKKVNYLKFVQLIDHRSKYCLKTKIPSICRSIQIAFIFDYFEELRPKDRSIEDYLKDLSSVLDTFNYKAFVNVFGMYERRTKGRAFRGGHIGNALMLESSFFNHSCSPNAYWFFNGQHISIITTKNIEKDQEVTISYGPYSESMPFEERQDNLLKRYFFQCNCNECISEAKSLPIFKCLCCSDGFFIYKKESTESTCMSCGEALVITSIVKSVEEIEKAFDFCMNEFVKNLSEERLIEAEKYYTNFCEYLYPKSERLIEINNKLSRSFETVENYSKAMFYSKNILDIYSNSLKENELFLYCIERVFYSRVYYYYLYKQRKTLTIDDEWRNCLDVTSETLLVLKNYKNTLLQKMEDISYKASDLDVITKATQMMDEYIESKEKQICIVSKMLNNPSSEPMNN